MLNSETLRMVHNYCSYRLLQPGAGLRDCEGCVHSQHNGCYWYYYLRSIGWNTNHVMPVNWSKEIIVRIRKQQLIHKVNQRI